MLAWGAVIGTFVTLFISVVAGFIAGRQRRKIVKLILDEVVEKKIMISEMKLINDLQVELQNVIKSKQLPVDVIISPYDKKRNKVTLKPFGIDIIAPIDQAEQQSRIELLKNELGRDLATASTAVVMSIVALMLVAVSFLILLKPSSKWDLLSVTLAPIGLIASMFIGYYLAKLRKKLKEKK